MKLKKIIDLLDLEVITCAEQIEEIEVESVGAADMMSEVLAFSKENALLLTGLTTPQVIRTAQMMDLAAILFVRGKKPQVETIKLSIETGIPLLVSKELLYIVCGKLYEEKIPGC